MRSVWSGNFASVLGAAAEPSSGRVEARGRRVGKGAWHGLANSRGTLAPRLPSALKVGAARGERVVGPPYDAGTPPRALYFIYSAVAGSTNGSDRGSRNGVQVCVLP